MKRHSTKRKLFLTSVSIRSRKARGEVADEHIEILSEHLQGYVPECKNSPVERTESITPRISYSPFSFPSRDKTPIEPKNTSMSMIFDVRWPIGH